MNTTQYFQMWDTAVREIRRLVPSARIVGPDARRARSMLASWGISGISHANHAIWSDCCVAGTLDSTLVRDGGGTLRPTGQWWVYKAYADVSGQLVVVDDNGGTTDAVPARNGTVLLGGRTGNTGTVTAVLNGLTGRNQVTVQRIPDQGPLDQPLTVSSQTVSVTTARIAIP
ncbi:hypothetical protein GCM10029964_028190 [Kibdelosporangium lantanae]